MSSTFGTVFKVTTFGESHGKGVGAVVDGCPPGLAISERDIQPQLDRRRPGQSAIVTQRDQCGRGRGRSADPGSVYGEFNVDQCFAHVGELTGGAQIHDHGARGLHRAGRLGDDSRGHADGAD